MGGWGAEKVSFLSGGKKGKVKLLKNNVKKVQKYLVKLSSNRKRTPREFEMLVV